MDDVEMIVSYSPNLKRWYVQARDGAGRGSAATPQELLPQIVAVAKGILAEQLKDVSAALEAF